MEESRVTFSNPLCPRCGHPFKWMRPQIRWRKYITARYVHHDGTCRVIYMTPTDHKKTKARK